MIVLTATRTSVIECFLAGFSLAEYDELQCWIDSLSEEERDRARMAAMRASEAAGVRALQRFMHEGIPPAPVRLGEISGAVADHARGVLEAVAYDYGDGILDVEYPHCGREHRHAGDVEDHGARRMGLCGREYRLHVQPAAEIEKEVISDND